MTATRKQQIARGEAAAAVLDLKALSNKLRRMANKYEKELAHYADTENLRTIAENAKALMGRGGAL